LSLSNNHASITVGTDPAVSGSTASAITAGGAEAVDGFKHYRWVICALLFFATTINYIDRQVIGILAPDLQRTIGWNDIQYGYIVTAFQAAYAVGLLIAGVLIDRFGARIGYSLSIIVWSVAATAHAFARSAFGFGVARGALGLGEAGNFPAAIKIVAE